MGNGCLTLSVLIYKEGFSSEIHYVGSLLIPTGLIGLLWEGDEILN